MASKPAVFVSYLRVSTAKQGGKGPLGVEPQRKKRSRRSPARKVRRSLRSMSKSRPARAAMRSTVAPSSRRPSPVPANSKRRLSWRNYSGSGAMFISSRGSWRTACRS